MYMTKYHDPEKGAGMTMSDCPGAPAAPRKSQVTNDQHFDTVAFHIVDLEEALRADGEPELATMIHACLTIVASAESLYLELH